MTRSDFVLIAVVCVSISLGIAFAQEDVMNGGTLRGQITDVTPAQNPVEGVEVKIVAQDGGKKFTTKTDADGNYEHAGLPAGRYSISISKEGYDELPGKPVTIVEGGDHFVPLKMARRGNIIVPFFELQAERKNNIIKQGIKPQIESLLQGITESVGKRYNLDATVVKTLHQSILDLIENALEQSGVLSTFASAAGRDNVELLSVLLSRLDCKVLFAKHLSEAQLQDYIDFTKTKRQQDQQAVARRITMLIDKELSLTADQREKIVKLLRGAAWNEAFPISMSVLRTGSQQAIHLVHYRLKISLDDILSEAQSKVWHGLVNTNATREWVMVVRPEAEVKKEVEDEKVDEGEIADPTKKRAFIRKDPVKHIEIREEVKIVINEVMIDPPEKRQPWIELNADTAESSPEQMMEIAEAKLVAHTELLGPLDERATRRLALVAKGVAEQSLDGLWGDRDTKIDITDHPMYQRTIKDVLSEEAFAAYRTYRAEREAWHQQAGRDVAVACMDTQLLLDNAQRQQLEVVASQLDSAQIDTDKPMELMFFQLFPQTIDFEILTPWQQGEFKRVFSQIMWRR